MLKIPKLTEFTGLAREDAPHLDRALLHPAQLLLLLLRCFFTCIWMYIYTYIYTHIYRESAPFRWCERTPSSAAAHSSTQRSYYYYYSYVSLRIYRCIYIYIYIYIQLSPAWRENTPSSSAAHSSTQRRTRASSARPEIEPGLKIDSAQWVRRRARGAARRRLASWTDGVSPRLRAERRSLPERA